MSTPVRSIAVCSLWNKVRVRRGGRGVTTGEREAGAAAVAVLGSGGRPSGAYPLVLVHGAGADATRFASLLAEIPGAVAIDLPGHGTAGGRPRTSIDGPGGYADTVTDLLRREGYERPIVVGHSMGGAIALTCALGAEVPLGGVALLGSAARLRVHPDILSSLAEGRLPPDLPVWMFGPDAPPAMVAAERQALAEAAASGVLYSDMAACDAFDVQDRLGALRLPAAVVVGSQDRMTPPRLADRLLAAWGDPEAIEGTVVDGAGHYVQCERPEAVARVLLHLRARASGDGEA
jgi:pimeloyl-ACP methyl ester carboxylesterase